MISTQKPNDSTVPQGGVASLVERAAALRMAVADAFWRHRRLGESVVVAHKGQIVELTGDEIPVDEETESRNLAQRRGEAT